MPVNDTDTTVAAFTDLGIVKYGMLVRDYSYKESRGIGVSSSCMIVYVKSGRNIICTKSHIGAAALRKVPFLYCTQSISCRVPQPHHTSKQ